MPSCHRNSDLLVMIAIPLEFALGGKIGQTANVSIGVNQFYGVTLKQLLVVMRSTVGNVENI